MTCAHCNKTVYGADPHRMDWFTTSQQKLYRMPVHERCAWAIGVRNLAKALWQALQQKRADAQKPTAAG